MKYLFLLFTHGSSSWKPILNSVTVKKILIEYLSRILSCDMICFKYYNTWSTWYISIELVVLFLLNGWKNPCKRKTLTNNPFRTHMLLVRPEEPLGVQRTLSRNLEPPKNPVVHQRTTKNHFKTVPEWKPNTNHHNLHRRQFPR